jgi:DNA-binding transcriptional LysR family regulator
MERESIAEEQTLLAVLDTGSFSAAAGQLGISQSSVSRRIATLEARLGGARLIARTTRRVEGTELGEAYAAKIRQALTILHDADQNALSRGDQPAGLLRVSLPPGIGVSKLLPVISQLAQTYSGLEFDVFLASRYLDLYEGKLDLAVRLMPFRRTDTHLVELGPVPWVFVAAPEYLRNRRLAARPHEHEFVVLNFRSGGPVDAETQKLLRVLARQNVRLRVNENNSLHRLVLDGHGVGLLPWPMVADDVRLGHLELVDVGLATTESRAYAICRRTLRNTAKVRVTLDAFKAAIVEDHITCQRQVVARRA